MRPSFIIISSTTYPIIIFTLIFFSKSIMQLQLVSDGTFRKVKNNIDRLFDKNLTDLIRGIRNNKENEARYIATCIEEIKAELRQDSTFIKANAIEKLAYLQMIGYDISWAAFNIIEVMASTKFSEKRIGYLAATQAFNDETDVLMLTTNLIRKDLQSSTNIYDIGVALNGLSCFVTTDLSRDLVNDIVNLLSSSRPYVRKKALLLLYKIFMKYPEALRSTFPRLRERLEDQDPGVQSAAVNVICELARKNPRNYIGLQNIFFKLLNTSSNNWMLIKIIKLFSSLVPYEAKLGRRLLEPLTNLINSTSAMSLLYECINTVIAILISISSEGPGDYTPSIQLCVQKLGVLIEDSDQNLKYLGLLAMGKILQTHPKAVQAHKDIVLRCLDDKDESIRLRALDLLYGMISKRNIMEIVRKLMEHLDAAEGSFYRDELLRRIIAICSHDSYKYITNFEWYISVLVELTKVEGTKHGILIAEQIQDVAVRVQSVRHFAVSQMVLLVQNAQLLLQGNADKRRNMAEVLLAAAWICGEFAQHVNDVWSLLESMLRLKLSVVPGALLSFYVQTMSKLYALQLCKCEAENDWDGVESLDNLLASKLPEFQFTDHLEAQERACNFMALLKFAIERHAERQKIGATLAKYFEGELNPVAAKAQRKVPIPDGLDLDAWINEPEPDSEEEEEDSDDEEDESETEEAVEQRGPPKTTSHYGAENLPQHGKKLPESTMQKGKANRDQSPDSYHRMAAGNGSAASGMEKKLRHNKNKETAESLRKRREFEQHNNPFYVKERPSQMAASSSKMAQQQLGRRQAPDSLQSPLEIEGVVGLEGYLAQKNATLSWKNVEKGKRRKKKQKADEPDEDHQSGSGSKKTKKRQNNKKRQTAEEDNGSGNEENGGKVELDDDDEDEGNQQREQQHFVYKGDGEMPEGALESSEEEKGEKLNDEFQAFDIGDTAYGAEWSMEEAKKGGGKGRRQRSSRESIRAGAGSLQANDSKEEENNEADKMKKKKKRIKDKNAAGEQNDDGTKAKVRKKKKPKTEEEGGEPEKKTKKKKVALSKKASLRKEYASIDSPTGGNLVGADDAIGNNEEQLISFGDDEEKNPM